jgi:HEAT repeat protein
MNTSSAYARDLHEIRKAREQIRKSIADLVRMTSKRSYEVRMDALEALGDSQFNLEPQVRKAIADRDELVRTTGAEIAGERRLTALTDDLVRRLKSDRSALVRSAAAVALGEMQAVETRNILKARISVSDDEERVGLYYALVRLGVRRYFKLFLNGLRHDFYRIRCATANLLPDLINENNRSMALRFLKDALVHERTVAARSSLDDALKEIGPRRKRRS